MKRKIITKLIKNPRIVFNMVKRYLFTPFIIKDLINFKILEKNKKRFSMPLHKINPQIYDKTSTTEINYHYIYHPAWAARILAAKRPKKHIDISSLLYFNVIVSAFVPVDFYDYRPADISLSDLHCGKQNLLSLSFPDCSVDSISCMHTIEHIGLGRYGDELDPDGDIKAINELKRVVSVGGSVLFVVPISGQPRIEYNANRVYSYRQIIEYFKGFELKDFSLIVQDGENPGIVASASESLANDQNNGCGCFWFIKK